MDCRVASMPRAPYSMYSAAIRELIVVPGLLTRPIHGGAGDRVSGLLPTISCVHHSYGIVSSHDFGNSQRGVAAVIGASIALRARSRVSQLHPMCGNPVHTYIPVFMGMGVPPFDPWSRTYRSHSWTFTRRWLYGYFERRQEPMVLTRQRRRPLLVAEGARLLPLEQPVLFHSI